MRFVPCHVVVGSVGVDDHGVVGDDDGVTLLAHYLSLDYAHTRLPSKF